MVDLVNIKLALTYSKVTYSANSVSWFLSTWKDAYKNSQNWFCISVPKVMHYTHESDSLTINESPLYLYFVFNSSIFN